MYEINKNSPTNPILLCTIIILCEIDEQKTISSNQKIKQQNTRKNKINQIPNPIPNCLQTKHFNNSLFSQY